eukprot:1583942-Prymnesium_polylepis.1
MIRVSRQPPQLLNPAPSFDSNHPLGVLLEPTAYACKEPDGCKKYCYRGCGRRPELRTAFRNCRGFGWSEPLKGAAAPFRGFREIPATQVRANRPSARGTVQLHHYDFNPSTRTGQQ